jgi:hypothetical protein
MFIDALTLDAPRRTKDGYMAVRARAARLGTYRYMGSEIDPQNKHGLRDAGMVNVLRDEQTVFDEAAVRSFIGKPVTDDHPSTPVTAANWRDHARGMVMGAIRDGDYLAFDLLLTDAAAIKKIDDGKRQLSNGYGAELEFGDFKAADGTECVARQVSISGNHVALIAAGRAGPECAITDAATCEAATAEVARLLLDQILTDERTYSDGQEPHKTEPARRETSNPSGGLRVTQDGETTVATKTILIDGYQFDADAALEVAVTKLQGQLKDAIDGRAADKAAHDKAIATKDAEIDDLKTKVVDQAKIDQLADAKAAVVADAKQVAGDKLGDTAGKSVADVRRMACVAVLGDAALKDKSDDYVQARFDTLKDGKGEHRDPVRDALSTGVRSQVNDNGASVRDLARAAQF